jgi:outer membrane protein assembly factor BamB
MARLLVPTLLALLAAVPLLSGDAPAPDKAPAKWTHWRGPSGQGHVEDAKAPLRWSEKENVLWKTKLPGSGHSSPIIWGDRIFLTSASEGGKERYVLCVRRSDGELLWQKTAAANVPREKTYPWTGYAAASCATDGKHVYAFFGSSGVFCYDFEGKQVWKKAFGTINSVWGVSATPFLYEGLVIQNLDNDGGRRAAPAALVAMDKKDGTVKWTAKRDQGRGFSTPRLMKVAGGREDLVLNGPLGVWGYDPKTGKERWHCRREADQERGKFGEPLPVDDGERMFILSGRTGPYQLLKMPGSGDVTDTHVLGGGTRKGRDVASPMWWKGLVYCVDRDARMTVFDGKTGKQVTTLALGKGTQKSLASPIALRGKLLWVLDEGTTVVVEPGAKPKIVGRNKLDGEDIDFGASPAVVEGKIYIRSRSHLYCIGEK